MMSVNIGSETSKPSSSNHSKFNLKTSSKSNVKRSSDETLFETLMNDPLKKAFLLRILTNEKENIKKYKDAQENLNKTPTSKQRRLHCESPSALLRRKVLEKNSDQQSSPSDAGTPTSSSIPFNRLLEGVIAYVEIRSKGMDRSAGAKTLMQSMGAKVVERLERGVTHVVFKDGSFSTYQKARLLKAYLVSVLWLEAVRKSNNRVPEKCYPALGIESYDVNMSEIFDEYESVVKEEYRRSVAIGSQRNTLQSQKKSRLTSLPSELALNRKRSNSSTPRRMSDIVPSSQEYELESIISCRSIQSSKTNSEVNGMDAETSDDDSERGLINGQSFSELKEMLLCNLESNINQYEASVSNQNIAENLHKELIENNKSTDNNQSNTVQSQNDILINNDNSVSTSSSQSISLLSRKSKVNVISDMNLTNDVTGNIFKEKEKSFKRRSLDFRDNSPSDHPSKKMRSTELVLSNASTKSSTTCIELSDTSILAPMPNTQIPKNSEAMSSLRVSGETVSNQSGSGIRNSFRLNDPPLQSKIIQTQSKVKIPAMNEVSVTSRKSKSSGTMSTLTILSENACKGEDSVGIRKSSRLSMQSSEPLVSLGIKNNLEQSSNISSASKNSDNSSDVLAKSGNLRILLKDCRSNPEMSCFFTKSQDVVVSRKSIRLSKSSVESTPLSTITDDLKDNIIINSIAKSKHVPGNRKSSRLMKSNIDNQISPELTAATENSVQQLKNNVISKNNATTTKRNSAPSGENLRKTRRSSRFINSNSEALTSSELTDVSLESHLTESLGTKSTSTRNRTSQTSHNISSSLPSEKNRNLSFTNSSPDSSKVSQNNLEKPLEGNKKSVPSCGSKNSDNMSSLRISVDNSSKSEKLSGNRKISSQRTTKSEVFVANESVKNLRRSLRRSTICASTSKNSETMSSLRVSTDSVLSKGENAQVTRKSSDLNVKNQSEIPAKDNTVGNKSENIVKRKRLRKLYNINQVIDNTKELSNLNEVEPLPIPVIGSNAKMLIVPLIRLRGHVQTRLKRKPCTEDVASKKTMTITKTVPTSTETEVNGNSHETLRALGDDNQIKQRRRYSLSTTNVSLLQTQLAPQESRRSTLEFIENPIPKKKVQCAKTVKTSIVCTRMHKPEVQIFTTAVQNLGNFYVEDEVSENTTHLIVGESKRTINLLKAISRGCWILTRQWLLKSIEVGKWVDEEDYELPDFSPAVKQCRTERQAFGDLYSMDIFNDCDPIYISQHSSPKRSDLIELIKLCKGKIVRKKNDAKIIVGDWVDHDGVKCVTEKWILDSITFNRKKSFSKYLIRNS